MHAWVIIILIQSAMKDTYPGALPMRTRAVAKAAAQVFRLVRHFEEFVQACHQSVTTSCVTASSPGVTRMTASDATLQPSTQWTRDCQAKRRRGALRKHLCTSQQALLFLLLIDPNFCVDLISHDIIYTHVYLLYTFALSIILISFYTDS